MANSHLDHPEKFMELNSLAKRRRSLASGKESGFTMVEMIVAIPIVLLVLGLVVTSIGVTTGLMGQVTKGAGAAKVASAAADRLTSSRNCAEVRSVVSTMSNPSYNEKFSLIFPQTITCYETSVFQLSFDVREKGQTKSYYSKSLTMSVTS